MLINWSRWRFQLSLAFGACISRQRYSKRNFAKASEHAFGAPCKRYGSKRAWWQLLELRRLQDVGRNAPQVSPPLGRRCIAGRCRHVEAATQISARSFVKRWWQAAAGFQGTVGTARLSGSQLLYARQTSQPPEPSAVGTYFIATIDYRLYSHLRPYASNWLTPCLVMLPKHPPKLAVPIERL